MTCIVGVVDSGEVWIGGDSAGVNGYLGIRTRSDVKVFRNGPFIMGFTTSFRMGQCLHHRLDTDELAVHLENAENIERFMVTRFVDAVRSTLKAAGWAQKHDEREKGGDFLVGCRGRLFRVESDYQVGEPADGYAAVGCGEEYAMGALYAIGSSLPAEKKVRRALEAAAHLSAGVRGPFTILNGGGS